MGTQERGLAVVTGASTGIGFELAKLARRERLRSAHRRRRAADPRGAGERLLRPASCVEAVQADLATPEGVDKLYAAANRSGRQVDALLANAGRGARQGVPRSGARRLAQGHRHQHHRHALPDPAASAATCARATPGAS